MSAAFTSGPWRVFPHSWCNTSVLADGFDHGICLLDINHATEDSQEADGAVMMANARLIAAAPDLLEAQIKAYYVLVDVANQWPTRDTAEGQKLLCDMRDSIANALGISAESVQDGGAA